MIGKKRQNLTAQGCGRKLSRRVHASSVDQLLGNDAQSSVCEDLVQCRLQLSSPIVAFSITDRPIALTYHANSV